VTLVWDVAEPNGAGGKIPAFANECEAISKHPVGLSDIVFVLQFLVWATRVCAFEGG
jgi:hypothetical protein